jgi:hypothetical protein
VATEVQGVGGETVAFEVVKEVFIPAPSGMPHPMHKENRGRRVEATPGLSAYYFDIVRLHVGR